MFESQSESTPTRSIPEMRENPATFSEWLFAHVLSNPLIPEDDIAKKFARAHQQQIEWPIYATELEEFILFFAEQSIASINYVTSKLTRELQNKDFDDYMRLLKHHQSQIETGYRSTIFALRCCWTMYQGFVTLKASIANS